MAMVPLYAAWIADLGPSDLLVIKCVCRHTERPTARMLAIVGAGAEDKIADLAPRLRCRECDDRVKAMVSIK